MQQDSQEDHEKTPTWPDNGRNQGALTVGYFVRVQEMQLAVQGQDLNCAEGIQHVGIMPSIASKSTCSEDKCIGHSLNKR